MKAAWFDILSVKLDASNLNHLRPFLDLAPDQ
jgi:hypothetical protein